MPKPYVELTEPSGDIWSFNDPRDDARISGSVVEFCQTVTLVRNIADTKQSEQAPKTTNWSSKAKYFTGAPKEPLEPGARLRRTPVVYD